MVGVVGSSPIAPTNSSGRWYAAAFTATLVHGVMVAGLLAGFWDAGVCIVGIVLDSLAAYAL